MSFLLRFNISLQSKSNIKNSQIMEKEKIDMFLGLNAENFEPQDLTIIKEKLEKIDDSKFYLVQSVSFQKPSTIFIIALVFGCERFLLDEIGMGILKLLTCYGCGLWWLIDLFTAKSRAKKYNFKKLNEILMVA